MTVHVSGFVPRAERESEQAHLEDVGVSRSTCHDSNVTPVPEAAVVPIVHETIRDVPVGTLKPYNIVVGIVAWTIVTIDPVCTVVLLIVEYEQISVRPYTYVEPEVRPVRTQETCVAARVLVAAQVVINVVDDAWSAPVVRAHVVKEQPYWQGFVPAVQLTMTLVNGAAGLSTADKVGVSAFFAVCIDEGALIVAAEDALRLVLLHTVVIVKS